MNFDTYALNYDEALDRGLVLSGESSAYFARRRAMEVARYAAGAGARTETVVEFGCGIGNNVQHLRDALLCRHFVGLDIASEPLRIARQNHTQPNVAFKRVSEFDTEDMADVVFVNGVFHHIQRRDHRHTLEIIHSLLAPEGLLALFDNNPINPGARWVMSRIPFDRDARMAGAYRLARLARRSGFVDVQLRFFFLFPRILAALRPLEHHIERWPFGAQYCLFARRA